MNFAKCVLLIFAWIPFVAAAGLRDLSSDQRVAHFERFLAARSAEVTTWPHRAHSVNQWLREHQAWFKEHRAEKIPEFFDLYLRRLAAFEQNEALAWLADRLITELKWARMPYSAATRETLRMYIDVALIFTAAPVSLRLTRGSGTSPVAHALDAVAYGMWNNRRMKQFIAEVAAQVPTAPRDAVGRARWFFAPYHAPCAGLD